MNTDEEVGAKLLAALNKVQVNGLIEFHSPLPGLTDEHSVAFLREKKTVGATTRWNFDFFLYDISIGSGYAELAGKSLIFGMDP